MFNFDHAAVEYDQFYQTPYGRFLDGIEKSAVIPFLENFSTDYPVLELGAGTGHWTNFLTDEGFEVIGVDVSEEMLKTARNKAIPNATFKNADMTNLPFEDDSFNQIAAFASIEFVDDPQKGFDEIKRVLKPGGSFLGGFLNLNSTQGKVKEQIEMFREAHFYSPESLKEILGKFGEPELKGCALLPTLGKNLEEDRLAEKEAGPNKLLEEGNFLVSFVQHTSWRNDKGF